MKYPYYCRIAHTWFKPTKKLYDSDIDLFVKSRDKFDFFLWDEDLPFPPKKLFPKLDMFPIEEIVGYYRSNKGFWYLNINDPLKFNTEVDEKTMVSIILSATETEFTLHIRDK